MTELKLAIIQCITTLCMTHGNLKRIMYSLSTYPFPIFFKEWGLDVKEITNAWDNKGDTIRKFKITLHGSQ